MQVSRGFGVVALGVSSLLAAACGGAAATAASEPTQPAAAAAEASSGFKITRSHVNTHPSQGPKRVVEGSEGLLVSWEEGAFIEVTTKELEPGNVYTLWFVTVNNPDACAERPCKPKDFLQRPAETQANAVYADGVVVPDSGEASFSAFVPAGSWEDGWWDHAFDPTNAEIHATINSHGPLMAEHAGSMLHSYRDQCTDDSVVPIFPEAAHADGEPGPNECALTQGVLFMQD